MITLVQVHADSALHIHAMQVKAFMPLYAKYRDRQTSPATEDVERVQARIADPDSRYFLIRKADVDVGAIRIQCRGGCCRISPLFVLPEYQGQGIAQRAMQLAEAEYPHIRHWVLETIMQEAGNCHLYEKMGYVRTGDERTIRDNMTLIGYEKHLEIE